MPGSSGVPPAPGWHVVLAGTRGFCAGVRRAVETVERALARHGAPVYVRHAIVHNAAVIARLEAMGARFVEETDEVPPGAVLVLSAHGVTPEVEREAGGARRRVIDATCPLVTRVHLEAERLVAQGREVVLIGHEGHPEVVGTLGRIGSGAHRVSSSEEVARLAPRDPRRVGYVTQTTLATDEVREIAAALRARFPALPGDELGPGHGQVCFATQNRQDAVRQLAAAADVVLVAGSPSSSNANRLVEVARRCGRPARLVASADGLDRDWLLSATRIGLTAAASTPESEVQAIIGRLRRWRPVTMSELPGTEEPERFRLPASLDEEAGP